MTPESIRISAASLASSSSNLHDARAEGAALGRVLVSNIRARGVAARRTNEAIAMKMELELLTLAASSNELVAELADAALEAIRSETHLADDHP